MINAQPVGKRLMRLAELGALLMLARANNAPDRLNIHPSGMVSVPEDIWMPVEIENGKWAAIPGPEFCTRLYRGQNARYLPCRASLFRLPSVTEYLACVAKQLEFWMICDHHPGVIEVKDWTIAGCQSSFEGESQAQHYGLPTTLLDFSRSRDVAEFFARCRRVPGKDRIWEPLRESEFSAVMYTAELALLLADDKTAAQFVLTGPSPFLRPHRQKAVGLYLRGDCLTKQPYVVEQVLDYSAARTNELLELFDDGRVLFPDDAMSRIAHRIDASRDLAYEALKAAKIHMSAEKPLELLEKDLIALGYTISNRAPLITNEEFDQMRVDWAQVRNEYLQDMRIRWCADHMQES